MKKDTETKLYIEYTKVDYGELLLWTLMHIFVLALVGFNFYYAAMSNLSDNLSGVLFVDFLITLIIWIIMFYMYQECFTKEKRYIKEEKK